MRYELIYKTLAELDVVPYVSLIASRFDLQNHLRDL